MYFTAKVTLLACLTALTAQCGQKSGSDDESGGSVSIVPAAWDGSADYTRSTWEFAAP